MTEETVKLWNGFEQEIEQKLREVKLATLRECKEICLANDENDSASEIAGMIYMLEHPDFRA
jgi:hypothetical protein